MLRFVVFLLVVTAGSAGAVVIRDDVADSKYRLAASKFPPLADLPIEGHAVLISPQWAVTAAHAVSWQPRVDVVVLNGSPRTVEKVILHAGYKKLPQGLVDAAMKSGDATAAMEFLASSDDIALVKLVSPVTDIKPVAIADASAIGAVIQIIGKGATGTGAMGHSPHGPNRTDLRRAFSIISAVEGRWLSYTFRQPAEALPLEGCAGNGDSGGPLLVAKGTEWQVAALASWKRVIGNPAEFVPCKYGQINHGIRLAYYLDWIESTIAADGATQKRRPSDASG